MSKALYILAEMDDRDIEWLATAGRQKVIPPGSVLIEHTVRPDALYVVLSGMLSVQVDTPQGLHEIAQLETGDIVGEMSFIDARLPSATVIALEETLVWAIPWTKLSSKLMLDNSFASHFYHAMAVLLSDRVRKLLKQVDVFRMENLEQPTEEDLSPEVMNRFDLVRIRFDFLLQRLREQKY
ncbi:MAG: cyclic nucleotide-binding domain-containing protein [Cyanobacteria bacterium]|nr:cyclic nucleotide-binding domain-containing protein [Cyanobacteriota bacterium]MDW8201995.1 cyclic nucleotide-binding domain-containing protein [Cyanobacteriota bacterium SKYGB_h_bin112]